MLAPDGRCKTLDASADGYVRAENCIVMVLQPADGACSTACGLLAASAVGQVPNQRLFDASLYTEIITHAPCMPGCSMQPWEYC